MNTRKIALIAALTLVVAACGDGDTADTTVTTAAPTTAAETDADTTAPDTTAPETETTVAETAPEPEVTDITITQAVSSLAFLPIYVGQSQGFFEVEGINVNQVDTGGGGPDLQALLSGDAEFNAGAGTYQINALAQGQGVLNVYNYLNRSIINVALASDSAEELGITAESSLEEKLNALTQVPVGVTRPGSLTDATARFLIREAGFDPDTDATIIGVGGGPALIAALQQDQIEAIVISSPIAETAVAEGLAIMLVNNSAGEVSALDPFMMENVYVRQDFAEANPNTVAAFVRGVHEATVWASEASPEEVADAVAEFFPNLDTQVLIDSIVNVQAALNPGGQLDQQAVENTVAMLGTDVEVSDVMGLFTEDFLPEP